jgi:hypothetical protein
MDTPEKPSVDQIVFRSLFAGALWGIGWAVICFLLIALSGRPIPFKFMDVLMHGVFFGVVFGLVNGMLLSGGNSSSSLIPTCIMAVIFSCSVSFFSPSFDFFFANIIAFVLGAWAISDVALKMKPAPVLERKEKRKNS